jgi:radical SAM superfamily enzyme YgiQ (UPF0313 family)
MLYPLDQRDRDEGVMNVALVSVDPVALGCTRPSRNLGLYQLAAFARQDEIAGTCRLRCFDSVLENFGGKAGPCEDTHRLVAQLIDQNFEVIGLSTKIWNFYHVRNIARLLKSERPNTVIICGGYQIQGERFPRLMLTDDEPFDFLITGEGEAPFVDLLKFLVGRQSIESCRALWFRAANGSPVQSGPAIETELSSIPSTFGEQKEDDYEDRLIVLEASRGCPYQCHFCEWAATSNRVFALERVFAELDYVLAHGANRIIFADGTFNLDRKRRFHPILEYLLEQQRAALDSRGRSSVARGQVVLELRPELITDRCAELLEQLVTLFPETFYQFGLQTTDDQVGRLVGRPYDRRKWLAALQRLGPHARKRTGIDIIADLPGNSVDAVAESTRVALEVGAQSATYRLHVLPGTLLEKNAERLGLDFDAYPPHLVERWRERAPDEVSDLVAFGMMCSFLANELLPVWTELEQQQVPDVNFAVIVLQFNEWLQREGESTAVYEHLRHCFGSSERTPAVYLHKAWIAAQIPPLFRRFCATETFLGLSAGATGILEPIRAAVDLWNLQIALSDLGCDLARVATADSTTAWITRTATPSESTRPPSEAGRQSR